MYQLTGGIFNVVPRIDASCVLEGYYAILNMSYSVYDVTLTEKVYNAAELKHFSSYSPSVAKKQDLGYEKIDELSSFLHDGILRPYTAAAAVSFPNCITVGPFVILREQNHQIIVKGKYLTEDIARNILKHVVNELNHLSDFKNKL